MAKRLRWFMMGAGFGVGASFWARRKIKAKVHEITPLAVSKAAIDSVVNIKDRVVIALDEARSEVATTEAELREEMGLLPKRKLRAN